MGRDAPVRASSPISTASSATAVREGRRREFAKWPIFASEEHRELIADPNAVETFAASKLDWDELDEPAPPGAARLRPAPARHPPARDRAAPDRGMRNGGDAAAVRRRRTRSRSLGGMGDGQRAVALRQSRRATPLRGTARRAGDDRSPHVRERAGARIARWHERHACREWSPCRLRQSRRATSCRCRMSDDLDRLAAMPSASSSTTCTLTGETRARLRRAPSAACSQAHGRSRRRRGRDRAQACARSPPVALGAHAGARGRRCFMPDWLRGRPLLGRHLPALRPALAAQLGHRRLRGPRRASPRSPRRPAPISSASTRCTRCSSPRRSAAARSRRRTARFLNPLYIAIDKAPGYERVSPTRWSRRPDSRAAELVDYRRVGAFEAQALERLFRIFGRARTRRPRDDFEAFVRRARPAALPARAVRGAVGGHGRSRATAPTWHGWPDEFRHPGTDSVRAFAEEQADARHVPLLAAMARRPAARRGAGAARARPGMRIGLYLDLAVGVAPDGSATWSDRDAHRAGRARSARRPILQRRRPGLGPRAALARRPRRARLRAVPRHASTPCSRMPARSASTTP